MLRPLDFIYAEAFSTTPKILQLRNSPRQVSLLLTIVPAARFKKEEARTRWPGFF